MIINNARIEKLAVNKSGYPNTGLPEIAFAGRSNVGKSSLINRLTGRKLLARTSSKPGKTRTINFYNLEEKFYFVDLPGYGYANVSKNEKAKWGKMIEDYLRDRDELRAVALLVDIRHNPNENDKLMLNWLRYYNCPTLVVATKSDKINRSQISKHVKMIKTDLDLTENEEVFTFSSLLKQGIDELWVKLEELII